MKSWYSTRQDAANRRVAVTKPYVVRAVNRDGTVSTAEPTLRDRFATREEAEQEAQDRAERTLGDFCVDPCS